MIPKKSVFALAKALEGIPVLGALGGLPAARAGIRYGDIVLSINGLRTKSLADYVEGKALRTDGMTVIVFRDGDEKTLELVYDSASAERAPAAILAEIVAMRIGPPAADEGDAEAEEDTKRSS